MFGSSWMTSVVGYLVIILTVANQVYTEQGVPSTVHEWISFVGGVITGVGIALSKDFNKSNSPNAAPVAKSVPAVSSDPSGA